MADATGVMEKIKRAALDVQESTKPVNICFGKVVSGRPLEIRVEQKLLLGEKQLILTRNVTDFTVVVGIDWETEENSDLTGPVSPHRHRITGQKEIIVHNGLNVGDEVLLFRQQGGQKFTVIDRIGGTGQ